jgi:hypothetical protein
MFPASACTLTNQPISGLNMFARLVEEEEIMVSKFALIWTIVVVCLSGCFENTSSIKSKAGDSRRVDTCEDMIEYLQRAHLPTVKSVERWQNEYGAGLKISTSHYDIFTTLLEPLMLSQLPGFMESAHRGYNDQLPEPIETTTRLNIYLFAERKQWEDFTRAFAGSQAGLFCKIKAGAYYLNGSCVAYNIGRERTFSALGHESWHQFNSRHFKFRLPSWLDEGIAMLFETSRYEDGLFYFEPGQNLYRLGGLKKTLMENKMIPVRELIAMNPGEVLATTSETETLTAFYSQSYALVRFLREEGYGKRLTNYHQLLLSSLTGSWPLGEVEKRIAADRNIPLTVQWNRTVSPELFKHYISNDFDRIEKEYTAFCRKIVYHVHFK